MAEKRYQAAWDEYRSGFAHRLQVTVKHSYGGDKSAKKNFEGRVLQRLEVLPDVFRRWYKAVNMPDAFAISVILEELEADGRTGYGAEYLLLGDSPDEQDRKLTVHLLDTINDLRDDVHSVKNYLQNHELGVEGVIMRQSMRMLQHINKTKVLHRQGSDLIRSDEDTRYDEPFVAGYLPDDLVEIIAPHATHTRILTTHIDDGTDTENPRTRPWRYQNMISKCLDLGCEYEFILSGSQRQLKPMVESFRSAIARTRPAAAPKYRKRLKFRSTSMPIGAAYFILTLDTQSFRESHPSLYAELNRHYILQQPAKRGSESAGQLLGVVMSHSTRTHGGFVMDPRRAANAMDTYNKYRRESKVIDVFAANESA